MAVKQVADAAVREAMASATLRAASVRVDLPGSGAGAAAVQRNSARSEAGNDILAEAARWEGRRSVGAPPAGSPQSVTAMLRASTCNWSFSAMCNRILRGNAGGVAPAAGTGQGAGAGAAAGQGGAAGGTGM